MKIVVEGYDATGKSTLAQALAEMLGLDLVEAGPKPPSDLDAICDGINQLRMKNVVHSRITPVSRQAYQFDISDYHRSTLSDILARFVDIGAIFIYCVNTDNEDHELKDYDTPEHIEHITSNKSTICEHYDVLMEGIPHIRYDFRVNTIEEVLCKIADRS